MDENKGLVESADVSAYIEQRLTEIAENLQPFSGLIQPGLDSYQEGIRSTSTLSGGALVASIPVAELIIGSADMVEHSWLLRVAWMCWVVSMLADLFRWRVLPGLKNIQVKVMAQHKAILSQILETPDSQNRHAEIDDIITNAVRDEIRLSVLRLRIGGRLAVSTLVVGMFALAAFAHFNLP
jgi:hypothetical protein